jgi:hypothetical protein
MISMATVRSIVALVLAVSMLLPQYSCGEYVDMNGKLLTQLPVKADSGKTYRVVDVDHYVISEVDLDYPATLVLPLVFLWPLAAALFMGWRPNARVSRIIAWAEPALLAGSLYVIYEFAEGRRRYGNYLALGAGALLFALSLRSTVGRIRKLRSNGAIVAAA